MSRKVLLIVLAALLVGAVLLLLLAGILKPAPPQFSQTGGFELVYEVPAHGEKTRALTDEVIVGLKERFDPEGAHGIEFAIDDRHLTIRVPVPNERKAKRTQWSIDAEALVEIGLSPINIYALLHRNEPLLFEGRWLERNDIIDQIISENPNHGELIRRFADLAMEYDITVVDDSDDMVKLIKGMVPLEFHVAPSAEDVQDLETYVDLLAEDRNDDTHPYRWFPLHDTQAFADTDRLKQRLEADPEAFFADMTRMIARSYDGRLYLLLGNTVNDSLLPVRDGCRVEKAMNTTGPLGRPAIAITLNTTSGDHMRRITSANMNQPMAVVLGGEVYSAPNINSAIGREFIIQGQFSASALQRMMTPFKHTLPVPLRLVSSKIVPTPAQDQEGE